MRQNEEFVEDINYHKSHRKQSSQPTGNRLGVTRFGSVANLDTLQGSLVLVAQQNISHAHSMKV